MLLPVPPCKANLAEASDFRERLVSKETHYWCQKRPTISVKRDLLVSNETYYSTHEPPYQCSQRSTISVKRDLLLVSKETYYSTRARRSW